MTPADEDAILDLIGAAMPGEDLDAALTRTGSVAGAALSILRRRRATLGPDSWSLSGDYSQTDGGRTAAWLDKTIGFLEAQLGVPSTQVGTVRTSSLQRHSPMR